MRREYTLSICAYKVRACRVHCKEASDVESFVLKLLGELGIVLLEAVADTLLGGHPLEDAAVDAARLARGEGLGCEVVDAAHEAVLDEPAKGLGMGREPQVSVLAARQVPSPDVVRPDTARGGGIYSWRRTPINSLTWRFCMRCSSWRCSADDSLQRGRGWMGQRGARVPRCYARKAQETHMSMAGGLVFVSGRGLAWKADEGEWKSNFDVEPGYLRPGVESGASTVAVGRYLILRITCLVRYLILVVFLVVLGTYACSRPG